MSTIFILAAPASVLKYPLCEYMCLETRVYFQFFACLPDSLAFPLWESSPAQMSATLRTKAVCLQPAGVTGTVVRW